jgi:hypothetical protein
MHVTQYKKRKGEVSYHCFYLPGVALHSILLGCTQDTELTKFLYHYTIIQFYVVFVLFLDITLLLSRGCVKERLK